MRAKKILSITLAAVMMLSLSACGGEKDPLAGMKKSELIEKVHELEGQLEDTDFRLFQSEEEVKDLETKLAGIMTETSDNGGIREFGDGTGRLTLQSVDQKIKLPTEFIYPNSTQASTNSSLNVSKDVSIVPSNNWTIKIDANETLLEHISGISGTIKVGVINRELGPLPKIEDVNNQLSAFFTTMPAADITYNRIYLGNNSYVGVDALANTAVDEKPGFVRCGMMGSGVVSLTYFFYYDGPQDTSKDELISILLNSMKVGGIAVKIGS